MAQQKNKSKKIKFRKYRPNDYKMYEDFCIDNFGKNAHQKNYSYLEWLYNNPSKSFQIALSETKIVGIEHNFKAPIFINKNLKLVTVLHDLMVNEYFRGTVGLRLIQDSLKSDDYLVLPGSVGRLSRVYGKLGSKKIESFWYRKFQFPRNIFRTINAKRFINYQNLAAKHELLLGNNKERDNYFLLKSLSNIYKNDSISNYFDWRFFHKNAPLTFYVSDDVGENLALFIIGKKGLIPYARAFFIHHQNELIFKKIIKFIENITSKIGIPVILYTSLECPPPKNLGYKVYKELPISYVYSRLKKQSFNTIVPTFCSDIGFDGLNILKDT